MKKAARLILMFITIVMMSSCIGKVKHFKEVASLDNVETLHIGGKAAGMALQATIYGDRKAKTEVKDFLKSIGGIDIVSCRNGDVEKAMTLCRADLEEMDYSASYVRAADKEERITIYLGASDPNDSDLIEGMAIEVFEGGEYNLVLVDGMISRVALENQLSKEEGWKKVE